MDRDRRVRLTHSDSGMSSFNSRTFATPGRTYEWSAARWPSRTGRLADRLNGMPKYVVIDPRAPRLEQLDGRGG